MDTTLILMMMVLTTIIVKVLLTGDGVIMEEDMEISTVNGIMKTIMLHM